MKSAYDHEWLYNLAVIKETKRWFQQGLITKDQITSIHAVYTSGFYHPNFIIRILLFVATLLALAGVTGILTLAIADTGESVYWPCSIIYGLASFLTLEIFFIRTNRHYKSGVNEALIYHSCGFIILGVAGLADFDNPHVTLMCCVMVFCYAAIRYLDLLCTVATVVSLTFLIFFEFHNAGGIAQQVIPFAIIIFYTPVYFLIRILKKQKQFNAWHNNLVLAEGLSLILIYAAGNYLVVRELSESMMDLYLEEDEDIPFAIVFYLLTVVIPVVYLYFGIRNKDIVLLRVSLVLIAFSVFTFKYYYGFGHPEFSLTLAGVVLIGASIVLLNYLKTMRSGYTRENLLTEKWGNMNLQAFIVSQTMGGNQVAVDKGFEGGGGEFGGGGASGKF
jgi:hypothetical protein